MCIIFYFRANPCNHRWFTIGTPCRPNAGFNTCPVLLKGRITHPGPTHKVDSTACPKCGMKGEYDRNMIRLLVYEGPGYRWIVEARDPARAARRTPEGMGCCCVAM